jgi:hypothetical protein
MGKEGGGRAGDVAAAAPAPAVAAPAAPTTTDGTRATVGVSGTGVGGATAVGRVDGTSARSNIRSQVDTMPAGGKHKRQPKS